MNNRPKKLDHESLGGLCGSAGVRPVAEEDPADGTRSCGCSVPDAATAIAAARHNADNRVGCVILASRCQSGRDVAIGVGWDEVRGRWSWIVHFNVRCVTVAQKRARRPVCERQ